jgi:hypothetical protein
MVVNQMVVWMNKIDGCSVNYDQKRYLNKAFKGNRESLLNFYIKMKEMGTRI